MCAGRLKTEPRGEEGEFELEALVGAFMFVAVVAAVETVACLGVDGFESGGVKAD